MRWWSRGLVVVFVVSSLTLVACEPPEQIPELAVPKKYWVRMSGEVLLNGKELHFSTKFICEVRDVKGAPRPLVAAFRQSGAVIAPLSDGSVIAIDQARVDASCPQRGASAWEFRWNPEKTDSHGRGDFSVYYRLHNQLDALTLDPSARERFFFPRVSWRSTSLNVNESVVFPDWNRSFYQTSRLVPKSLRYEYDGPVAQITGIWVNRDTCRIDKREGICSSFEEKAGLGEFEGLTGIILAKKDWSKVSFFQDALADIKHAGFVRLENAGQHVRLIGNMYRTEGDRRPYLVGDYFHFEFDGRCWHSQKRTSAHVHYEPKGLARLGVSLGESIPNRLVIPFCVGDRLFNLADHRARFPKEKGGVWFFNPQTEELIWFRIDNEHHTSMFS